MLLRPHMSGGGAASRGLGSARVATARMWRRCPGSSLQAIAQRPPHDVQTLPVGPGLMEADSNRKLHMVVSLAGLTERQQHTALRDDSATHLSACRRHHPLG
jgi:hypothetical protein